MVGDGDSIFKWTPQNDRECSNGASPYLPLLARRSERGRVDSYSSLLIAWPPAHRTAASTPHRASSRVEPIFPFAHPARPGPD